MAQQQYQQPMQPSYQNGEKAQQKSKWAFGYWDCCSPLDICCLGCWCPCVLFGKTQARLEGETDPSGCNMSCCLFYLTCHFGIASCYQASARNSMRKKYNIEGTGFMDCLGACCCINCNLVQEEKEALIKTTGIDPKTKQQYQAPGAMAYA